MDGIISEHVKHIKCRIDITFNPAVIWLNRPLLCKRIKHSSHTLLLNPVTALGACIIFDWAFGFVLFIIIYGIRAETLPPAKVKILTLTYFIHLESMYNVDFYKCEYQINVKNIFFSTSCLIIILIIYCTHSNCMTHICLKLINSLISSSFFVVFFN